MPFYKSFCEVFEDFPQLLLSEASLFLFSEGNLPIERKYVRLISDLSYKLFTLSRSMLLEYSEEQHPC